MAGKDKVGLGLAREGSAGAYEADALSVRNPSASWTGGRI